MGIYQPSNRNSSPPPKLSVLFMNQTWVLLVMKARLGRLFFFMARVCPAVQRFYGYNCEDKKIANCHFLLACVQNNELSQF